MRLHWGPRQHATSFGASEHQHEELEGRPPSGGDLRVWWSGFRV